MVNIPQNVETRLFIGGEFVESGSGETFDLYNPATEELTYKVHEATEDDVNTAVEHAKKAQPAWADLSTSVRSDALIALADLITENIDRFAELDSVTMGIPVSHYKLFMGPMVKQQLYYFAHMAFDVHGDSHLGTADRLDIIFKQPYGVTAVIIPWNAPLILGLVTLGPALVTGNAVIMKSSEKAPLGSIYLAQLIQQTGKFPKGIVQIISGRGPTTGAALARHMEIRKLAFIGSVSTGRKIKEMAAQTNLKNVTLELGGKSPLIVFEDANLQKAAQDAAMSISFNSGQTCSANSRLYVQKSIHERFIEAYKAAMQKILLNPGDPLDSTTLHGPQVDELQFKHVMGLVEAAKAQGIEVALGGNRATETGYFVEPTIFLNAPEDSDIVKKEVFGPVSVVNTFETEEEVLKKANDTEYGLYASVYTKDISRAIRCAKKLEAGSVSVNASSTSVNHTMPFGGWKQSGEGRQLGRAGLDSWLETKSVFIDLQEGDGQ